MDEYQRKANAQSLLADSVVGFGKGCAWLFAPALLVGVVILVVVVIAIVKSSI